MGRSLSASEALREEIKVKSKQFKMSSFENSWETLDKARNPDKYESMTTADGKEDFPEGGVQAGDQAEIHQGGGGEHRQSLRPDAGQGRLTPQRELDNASISVHKILLAFEYLKYLIEMIKLN